MDLEPNNSYDYRNVRVGRSPYVESLTDIQRKYITRCADTLTEDLILLHRQLKAEPPWSTKYGFTEWTHSAVRTRGIGVYEVELYLKKSDTHLGSSITVYTRFDDSIEVVAKAGSKHLVATKLPFTSNPEDLSKVVVDRWKDQLTGKAKWASSV